MNGWSLVYFWAHGWLSVYQRIGLAPRPRRLGERGSTWQSFVKGMSVDGLSCCLIAKEYKTRKDITSSQLRRWTPCKYLRSEEESSEINSTYVATIAEKRSSSAGSCHVEKYTVKESCNAYKRCYLPLNYRVKKWTLCRRNNLMIVNDLHSRV
jgi:hypothetical protein